MFKINASYHCRHDPEFRKTIETNIPGSEYVIKVCLREGKPPIQIQEIINDAKHTFDEMIERVNKFFGYSKTCKYSNMK